MNQKELKAKLAKFQALITQQLATAPEESSPLATLQEAVSALIFYLESGAIQEPLSDENKTILSEAAALISTTLVETNILDVKSGGRMLLDHLRQFTSGPAQAATKKMTLTEQIQAGVKLKKADARQPNSRPESNTYNPVNILEKAFKSLGTALNNNPLTIIHVTDSEYEPGQKPSYTLNIAEKKLRFYDAKTSDIYEATASDKLVANLKEALISAQESDDFDDDDVPYILQDKDEIELPENDRLAEEIKELFSTSSTLHPRYNTERVDIEPTPPIKRTTQDTVVEIHDDHPHVQPEQYHQEQALHVEHADGQQHNGPLDEVIETPTSDSNDGQQDDQRLQDTPTIIDANWVVQSLEDTEKAWTYDELTLVMNEDFFETLSLDNQISLCQKLAKVLTGATFIEALKDSNQSEALNTQANDFFLFVLSLPFAKKSENPSQIQSMLKDIEQQLESVYTMTDVVEDEALEEERVIEEPTQSSPIPPIIEMPDNTAPNGPSPIPSTSPVYRPANREVDVEDSDLPPASNYSPDLEEQSKRALIHNLQEIVQTPLETIKKEMFQVRDRTVTITTTALSLIPEEERRSVSDAATRFHFEAGHAQTMINQLEQNLGNQTEQEIKQKAEKIFSDLATAAYHFEKTYAKNPRVAKRMHAFERSHSTPKSKETITRTMAQLTTNFTSWATTRSSLEISEQKKNTKRLEQQLKSIQSKVPPPAKSFLPNVIRFQSTINSSYPEVHHLPIHSQRAQFKFLGKLQKHLNACIEAYESGDEEQRYTHAYALFNALHDAQEKAATQKDLRFAEQLYGKASPALYQLDTISEKSQYPTQIRQEEQLRDAVQASIKDTETLFEHVKAIKHQGHALAKQLQTFKKAAKVWQSNRVGATPEQRAASNQVFMQAYEALNQWTRNQHAQRIFHENKGLTKAWNALITTVNAFRWLVGLKPYAKVSQEGALNALKTHMHDIEQMPENQAKPSELKAAQNTFETERNALRLMLNQKIGPLREIKEQEIRSLMMGAKGDKPFEQEAKAAKDALRTLEWIDKNLKIFEAIDSSDPSAFLTGASVFAKQYDTLKPHLSKDVQRKVDTFLTVCDEHSQTLGLPCHIAKGRALDKNLQGVIKQLDKQIKYLEGRVNSYLNTNASLERNQDMLKEMRELKTKAKAFQDVHAQTKADSWIPRAANDKLHYDSDDFAAFNAFVAKAERVMAVSSVNKDLVKTLGQLITDIRPAASPKPQSVPMQRTVPTTPVATATSVEKKAPQTKNSDVLKFYEVAEKALRAMESKACDDEFYELMDQFLHDERWTSVIPNDVIEALKCVVIIAKQGEEDEGFYQEIDDFLQRYKPTSSKTITTSMRADLQNMQNPDSDDETASLSSNGSGHNPIQ
ncbi:MAG: hypothetical protein P1U61_05450 [Legionellaceae bacterium]|nr:hypothetical protein [Legionellaceae bacterium]